MSGAVLIMAGGTGGHIFPGLAVADELKRRGVSVAWLGGTGEMETELVPGHDIPMHTLTVRRLRGQKGMARLLGPMHLIGSIFAAVRLLRRLRPAAVLSMGGFVAGPGGLAAWLLRRPLVVHEQNSIAGWTNRVLARFALRLLCAFPDALGSRSEVVGNPVRASLTPQPQPAVKGRPVRVLVLGGSLGAMAINQAMPEALAALDATARPDVLHQAGKRHAEALHQTYEALGVAARVESFIDDMGAAYGWADFVVARAGALTLAELCIVGRPSILVPFPHAVDDHQTENARHLERAGAARLIPESQLHAELKPAIEALAASEATRQQMARAARSLGRPDAATAVASVLQEVMHD